MNNRSRWRGARPLGILMAAALTIAMSACSSLEVRSCGAVLGSDAPRIRSSLIRMKLADPAAAARRIQPYALMSALAYEDPQGCSRQRRLDNGSHLRAQLESWKWQERGDEVPGIPKCEDELGLSATVWTRDTDQGRDVVLAFRGTTPGISDWIHGNLRWVSRFWPGEDQYDRAEHFADAVVRYFLAPGVAPKNGKPTRFYATGHSLGGGLAQKALYHRPRDFIQAFAFDPSPVTGYADGDEAMKRDACQCLAGLGKEARIYRIYESQEILAFIRFPLKLLVPIARHIQEVRFAYSNGNAFDQHGMEAFALALNREASGTPALPGAAPWYAGREEENGKSCTAVFEETLETSCRKDTSQNFCPY